MREAAHAAKRKRYWLIALIQATSAVFRPQLPFRLSPKTKSEFVKHGAILDALVMQFPKGPNHCSKYGRQGVKERRRRSPSPSVHGGTRIKGPPSELFNVITRLLLVIVCILSLTSLLLFTSGRRGFGTIMLSTAA